MASHRDAESMSESESSSSSVTDEEQWQDVEPEEDETVTVVSLFDDATFPDAKSMLAYCKEKFSFDFLATCQRLGLDFHGAVKLCNFVRQQVRAGTALPETISAKDIQDDALLRPVLQDDALIIELDDLLDEEPAPVPATATNGDDLAAKNALLETELAKLQEQFASYRLAVEETLDKRWGTDAAPTPAETKRKAKGAGMDVEYWESYAGRDIHETMIKDAIRTDAYRDFVYGNKDVFKGKVVLDIGCGTGILSMFCAKAGAKKVLAVDNSAILDKARQNVYNNGLSDVITCISGRIEDVVLPVEKVDVIISEWMGYCLLYEAMLPSVLWARDRYLSPEGILVPSIATIWAAPVADGEYVADNIGFWRDVYGFDMKSMQEGIYDETLVQALQPASLCGEPFMLADLQLHDTKTEDLNFSAKFSSKLTRDADNIDGFLVWFDIFFTTSRQEAVPEAVLKSTPPKWADESKGRVDFHTGPFGTETHWKQGLLLAPAPDKKDGETDAVKAVSELKGEFTFAALASYERALELKAEWAIEGQKARSKTWKLA